MDAPRVDRRTARQVDADLRHPRRVSGHFFVPAQHHTELQRDATERCQEPRDPGTG